MTIRKLGLAVSLLLGVASATLIVQPVLAQVPNPGAEAKANELVVFALKYSSADDIARVLNDLYSTGSPTPGGGRRSSTISMAVDNRANSLIVSAPASRLDEIKALIAKLDVDHQPNAAVQSRLRVFPLRFAEMDKSLDAALQMAIGNSGQFTVDRVRKQVIVNTNDDAVLRQVQDLLARLDVATSERSSADVQVRVVWLVQGRAEEFAAPPDDVKDVLPVLAKLGIEKPRLAAQTIVNVAPNSPFSTDGTVKLNETVRFSIQGQFLEKTEPASLHIAIHAGGQVEICKLSTDITAPMGHLVVLGVTPTKDTTSVFIVQVTRKEPIKPSR